MQFYKVHCELTASECDEGEKRTRKEIAHRIASRTEEFNGVDTDRYCFLSDMGENYVALGMISACVMNLVDFADKYIKFIDIKAKASLPCEITLGNFQVLLNNAERQSYIENADNVLERFGLDRISGRHGRRFEFGENLVNYSAKKEELFANAKKLFASETLIPELERIYKGGKSLYAKGHPVHYIVESDDRDKRREIYKTVLDALYVNIRLGNCRYSFLDVHSGESYSYMSYEALYKISDGGAVVVRYLAGDDALDESSATFDQANIEHICEMAKRYRNKVLTVFCFPRACKNVKAMFYENLTGMTFIELREDFMNAESAKAYLTSLAKENHVRTDKKLFERIDNERTYLAAELSAIFEEWYNKKLKSSVYPQYKTVGVSVSTIAKEKPKGSAYEELMEMIGLEDAKQVIKKALNYYKMQKLYDEQGVKRDNPAMHMVFSGNPGTAKTTVARLVARIMRENGLLSRGQLVEVGRSELVGKYVGWTANIVKEKFKEASGGVLFIDEAYSLVDDRDGSYGDEAINTIVQEMENHRADVVVIFAGYPDKMEGFLQKNPAPTS